MNILTLTQKAAPTRFFAAITIVSLLLSALPVSFFIANAGAQSLYANVSQAVSGTSELVSNVIDASAYTNLEFAFAYNAEELDATDDSFTYGWRTGSGDNDVDTIVGLANAVPAESGVISVPLPVGAEVADLQVYVRVDAVPGAASDQIFLTNIFVTGDLAVVACTPQFDAAGVTDIQNTRTGDSFDSINDALADCDTQDGDTIALLGDITITEQQTLNREITLDGQGNTINAEFYKTENGNNAAIGIGSDDVEVKNITLDGAAAFALQAVIDMSTIPEVVAHALTNPDKYPLDSSDRWRLGLHGLNIYEVEDITIENVTSKNFRSGMVVNGSTVDVSDFSTAGNAWHGINVAPGSGVTSPSVLNISNTSSHGEVAPVPHIFTDNIFAGPTITVNDIDDQYDFFDFPEVESKPAPLELFARVSTLVAPVQVPTARAYFLKDSVDPIYGCIDAAATNYNPAATEQGQEICEYPPVSQCIDIDANLLLNGSFEEPEVTNTNKWEKFGAVPGWTVTKVSDDALTTLELHKDLFSNEAAEGDQYAELDGDHSTKIAQIVNTLDRGTYELKWSFAARHDLAADQNSLSVMVNGVEKETNGPATGSAGLLSTDWVTDSYTFVATSDATEIAFADRGPDNSFGTYIDDVQLCLTVEPEPPTVCSYAGEIVSYSEPAERNNSTPVPAERRNISAVSAGVASYSNFFGQEENDWQVSPLDFFTLGIEGEMVYEFTDKVALDIPGDDIAIWEITGGDADTQSDERVEVWLSEDGINFELAETLTSGDGSVDIADTSLSYVQFVKLVDDSRGTKGPNGDGYDVDAITIIGESCAEPEPVANLHTAKIVCTDESDLPNWGKGAPGTINANTAADWISEAHPSCSLVEGWEFEWAPKGNSNPGDTLVGPAGGDWTTFTGSTVVPASTEKFSSYFWVREVLQADYIPFAYEATKNKDDYSAEMYCHKDGKNYDNLDRVDKPVEDGDYYCVAWNHEDQTVQESLDITSPAVENQVLAGTHTFTAEYVDTDETIDDIQWAIRPGVCETSSVNLAGNVGGLTDASTFVGTTFSADVNMTTWDDGPYCFVVNPQEGPGENDLREVETFILENPVTYGSYCGDGVQNGDWEQCDSTDVANGETCTDYCTLDNQCTNLQLVKITLDETDSESFDEGLYLGASDNEIPNGTWFNFEEAGDQSFVTTANAVEGLAIERNQADGTLGLAFVGGNGSRQIDQAAGSIMTVGIELGAVDRAPNPSFKLEDGSGSSFDDVFSKTGENVIFDLRADTGNDGVTVVVGAGKEYDCPACRAGVEARIVVAEGDYGQTGLGQENVNVLLGDGTRVEYGEWFTLTSDDAGTFITDASNATNFTDAETTAGLFVSRNGDGTMNVALVGEHDEGGNTNNEWVSGTVEVRDASIASAVKLSGDFKFETHNNGSVASSIGFDVLGAATTNSVDFKMWTDTGSDGFKVTVAAETIAFCADDTVDKMIIDGFKYKAVTLVESEETEQEGEGASKQILAPVEDWVIELYSFSDVFVASTTTNGDGKYSFMVDAGDYQVREVMQEGWSFVEIYKNESLAQGTQCTFEYDGADVPYQCSFVNQQNDDGTLDTFRIAGTVFDTTSASEVGQSGATVFLVGTDQSTTTDADGNYFFKVLGGDWEVSQTPPTGFEQIQVEENGVIQTKRDTCVFSPGESDSSGGDESTTQSQEVFQCDFFNSEIPTIDPPIDPPVNRSSGRGGSTRVDRDVLPTPLVAGVSTIATCPFLVDFMQIGVENDEMEVKKLQLFLNIFGTVFGGSTQDMTGEFDDTTDANVKAFQRHFAGEILNPWFERGIVPHTQATGFVYKTTLWKINDIVCPDYAITPDFEGEDLSENVNNSRDF